MIRVDSGRARILGAEKTSSVLPLGPLVALMLTVDVSQWLVDMQSFKLFSLTQNLIRMEKHRMKKLQLSGYSRTSPNGSFKILCLDTVLVLLQVV